MMRRIVAGFFILLLTFSLPGLSLAAMLKGKLMKIEGSTYVVKDHQSGKERRFMTDQSTAKEGEIKEGVVVEIELDDVSGLVKSIKAVKA